MCFIVMYSVMLFGLYYKTRTQLIFDNRHSVYLTGERLLIVFHFQ